MVVANHSIVKSYYNRRESRWGYKYLLKGTKHYGYYPSGKRSGLSLAQAQRLMERKLGKTLGLPKGSKVLDAGCGEGHVAIHLAEEFGYELFGIDIIDWSIDQARQNQYTTRNSNVHFEVQDYSNLTIPDKFFDGVYTMEALVHSPNFRKTLKELRRVLKPGGVIVNHEYVLDDDLPPKDAQDWHLMFSECPMGEAFTNFRRSRVKKLWEDAGFEKIVVSSVTKNITPFMRSLYLLGFVPYYILKAFNNEKKYVNTFAGVRSYQLRDQFQYSIIRAQKPHK